MDFERLTKKVESIIESQLQKFEDNPLATSFKLLIYYWIFNKIYQSTKGEVKK